MRRTRFDEWLCPIARATDVVGDWWTPLVMRDVFAGKRRFAELQDSLGVPKAVLTARLQRLVAEGMLAKVAYQDHPVRYEYRPTEKGDAFGDVLLAMWRFGADWLWPDGEAPMLALKSRATNEIVEPAITDEHTGERLSTRTVRIGRNRTHADHHAGGER